MPPNAPSAEETRRALDRLLAWPGLARSPQLGRFLSYVVEATLRGDREAIKAYSIAVDVFRRPADFDPQHDPIVRVQARRLRGLIGEYYATDGAGDPVRIGLPTGRYVPSFYCAGAAADDDQERREDAGGTMLVPGTPPGEPAAAEDDGPPAGRRAMQEGPRRPPRSAARATPRTPLIVALAVVSVGLLASLILFILAPRTPHPTVPAAPTVAVLDFQVAAGSDQAITAGVSGLAVQLVRDMQLFGTVGSMFLDGDGSGGDASKAGFILGGLARNAGDAIQVTATLRPAGSDVTIWSQTVDAKDGAADWIGMVSRSISERLGSLRGPLHKPALAWLDSNRIPPGAETEYACTLLFGRYRDTWREPDRQRARDCVDMLLQRLPDSPTGLALSGGLAIDEAIADSSTLSVDPARLGVARRFLLRARGLASTSALVWEQWARLMQASGEEDEADKSFAVARQLNPANLDVAAEYGALLSLTADSPRGGALADLALANESTPPFWYHAAPAVNALRTGDNVAAVREGEALARGDGELGLSIAAAAAQRAGDQFALDRDIAQLLEVKRFRRFGIEPVLRSRLADAALVDTILVQLRAAGVPVAALNGPF